TRQEFTDQPGWDFLQWLRRFFEWLASLHATAPVLFWVLLVSCVLLLVLLGVHIVWTVRRVFFAGEGGVSAASRQEQQRRLWREHRENALRCAARGDFTEA